MSIGVAAAFKGIEHRAVDHVIAMKDAWGGRRAPR
jgi:hypothetical protein